MSKKREKGKDLLSLILDHRELDRIQDGLRVLLDDLFDFLLLKVIELGFLETTARWLGEGITSSGLPDALFIIIMLGDNLEVPRRNT